MSLNLTSTRSKVIASAALLAAAAGAAGLGTFGSFTSATSASATVASGTVKIAIGAAGTATNRLTIGATGLVPGDTIQRAVTLSNTGDQALASITLATSASPTSLLDSDVTNGLQMTIQSCPTAWTEAGTAPAYTYSCTGTRTTVLASTPIITAASVLPGLNSLANGGSDNLMVTLTFPSGAGNTLQGLSSTVSFGFTGLQRVATNK